MLKWNKRVTHCLMAVYVSVAASGKIATMRFGRAFPPPIVSLNWVPAVTNC